MDWIFEDGRHNATIDWTKPTLLSEAPNETRNDELLYLISAAVGNRNHKLLYVGQAYSTRINKRLTDVDHQMKQKKWMVEHPRHKFYVRYGQISIEGLRAVKDCHVDDVENILIYCLDDRFWKNKKGVNKSKISSFYSIENKGNKGDLPKRIGYGMFASAR